MITTLPIGHFGLSAEIGSLQTKLALESQAFGNLKRLR